MNPYHQFLDLPESVLSPDYYALLGLPRFTSDPKLIRAAAVERNSQLRKWDNTKHFQAANLLLDEVVAAALVLEDPKRKAAYDAQFLPQMDHVEAAEKQARGKPQHLQAWVAGLLATATAAILLLVAFHWLWPGSQEKPHVLHPMPTAVASPTRVKTDPLEDPSITEGLPVATIEEAPAVKDDPKANLMIGQELCFGQGDWDSGLKLMARGSDADLRSLAEKDLASPTAAAEQMAVGDGWWDVAQNETGLPRAHVATRSAYWYQKARGSVSGLTAVKLDQRIRECLAFAAGTSAANKIPAP